MDWDGDNTLHLLVGVEGSPSLFWYENAGSNADRKFVFRGAVQADGRDLVLPAKPCPESPHYKRDYAPSVEAVDWDADGDIDLLLGGYITGYVWFYENVGKRPDGSPALHHLAPCKGIFLPEVELWDEVAAGQSLGRIVDSAGRTLLVSAKVRGHALFVVPALAGPPKGGTWSFYIPRIEV